MKKTIQKINGSVFAGFRFNNKIYQVEITHFISFGVGRIHLNSIILPDGSKKDVSAAELIFQDGNNSNRKFRCIHEDKHITYHRIKPTVLKNTQTSEWNGLDWVMTMN